MKEIMKFGTLSLLLKETDYYYSNYSDGHQLVVVDGDGDGDLTRCNEEDIVKETKCLCLVKLNPISGNSSRPHR